MTLVELEKVLKNDIENHLVSRLTALKNAIVNPVESIQALEEHFAGLKNDIEKSIASNLKAVENVVVAPVKNVENDVRLKVKTAIQNLLNELKDL